MKKHWWDDWAEDMEFHSDYLNAPDVDESDKRMLRNYLGTKKIYAKIDHDEEIEAKVFFSILAFIWFSPFVFLIGRFIYTEFLQ